MADVMSLRREAIANAPHIESASGSYASFETDMAAPLKECKVSFEPVQDLHGYDYPWPAGSGANKFAMVDAVGVNQGSYGLTVDVDAANETARLHGTPTWTTSGNRQFRFLSVKSDGVYGHAPVTHDYSGFSFEVYVINKSSNITTVNYVTYGTDGTMAINLVAADTNDVDLTVKIVAYTGTAPSEWTPYENVCPIEGFNSLNIHKTGSNLFNTEMVVGAINTSTGVFNTTTNNLRVRDKILVPKGAKLVLSWSESGRNIFPFVYKTDGSFSRYLGLRMYSPSTFTLNDDESYFAFYQYNNSSALTNIKLEIGTAATSHEVYSGEDISVEFPVLGKNMIPYPYQENRTSIASVDVDIASNGAITVDGTVTGGTMFINLGGGTGDAAIGKIIIEPGTYTLSGGDNRFRITAVKNGIWFASTDVNTGKVTFTIAEESDMYFYVNAAVGSVFDNETYYPMLEVGSTATTFEPYSNTAYGGYLDLISGRLTLTSKYEDMKHTNHRYYMTSGTDGKYVYTNTGDEDRCALSAGRIGEAMQIELFTHGKIGNPYQNTQNPGNQVAWAFDGTIRFTAFGCETIEEFMEYVNSQKEFGLYYPLLTPIIHDLTPQQLKSLRGQNNIWSDANGEVEVKYWTY